ncbi:unnamed protein product, partial [Heterosigma akashiwo]
QVGRVLAEDLPEGALALNAEVRSVAKGGLTLASGQKVICDAVVVAADPIVARKLLNEQIDIPEARASTCLYYAIDGEAPQKGAVLILNGEPTSAERPVNNVVFLEQCAPSYAPPGKSLASVTVVGDPEAGDAALEPAVRAHLAEMFGPAAGVEAWRLLRVYRIPYAQPAQTPPNAAGFAKDPLVSEGVFCCGDHRGTATLNGAFESGLRATDAVLAALAAKKEEGQQKEGGG